jgi:peptidoglycan/LPS O-acetylase OafA/YrhL
MSDVAVGKRMTEVDALRGLAAAAVVLFHYTTRFTEVYRPTALPSVSFPGGQYGVNHFSSSADSSSS